jgi:hypothetical protein
MSEKLKDHLAKYIQTRVGVLKKYLIAALNSEDNSIWYLEYSAGMAIPSSDLKNCQLLRDAQVFEEDTRITRNGRNTYKIYRLTEFGKKLAEEIKEEGVARELRNTNNTTTEND